MRIALTENPNTPARILAALASDENADVRYNLAENHNAPLSVLSQLCDDENPYVADRANRTLNRLQQATFSSPAWFPSLTDTRQNLG